MQLDVDIEPTLRFLHMTSIDKQMDKSEGSFPLSECGYLDAPRSQQHACGLDRQTDRQTESDALLLLKSPPCNLHRWAQKVLK